MTDTDLTRFKYDLLTVIASDPEDGLYGLEIKDRIEDEYGKEIHHGRLYPNLDDLASKGLIRKSERDKRTNGYHLTERGRRTLEDRFAFVRNTIAEGFDMTGERGDWRFERRD